MSHHRIRHTRRGAGVPHCKPGHRPIHGCHVITSRRPADERKSGGTYTTDVVETARGSGQDGFSNKKGMVALLRCYASLHGLRSIAEQLCSLLMHWPIGISVAIGV